MYIRTAFLIYQIHESDFNNNTIQTNHENKPANYLMLRMLY